MKEVLFIRCNLMLTKSKTHDVGRYFFAIVDSNYLFTIHALDLMAKIG